MARTASLTPPIVEPGIYQLPDDVYFGDPVIEPSLNNSVAKELVGASPAHAHAVHPRLGGAPDDERDSTEAQDIGTVAHQMFLHGESRVRIVNVKDWRTNAAKELRDRAIRDGVIPLKVERYDAVRRVVDALERFRDRTGAFTAGKPEQTLVWREGKRWSRCKVDWLPDEPSAPLWDLKTTSGRATPQWFGRNAFDLGYEMAASYYSRGAECTRGEPPDGMKFCVVETKAPYGIRVFSLSPAGVELADAEVYEAIALWDHCWETGAWPNYDEGEEWLDPPPFKLREWEWRTRTGRGLARGMDPAVLADHMIKAGNLGG